jgi:lipopolysaccharide/colanic/teichoic acid biosynthesis glycosyltransferase
MSMPVSRKHEAPRTAPEPLHQDVRESRSPVLGEELFSRLLIQERKRSERSNRPFLLMTLKANERLDLTSSRAGKTILQTLAGATRGTDILGWVKQPALVGVVFPEIGSAEPGHAAEAVRARLHQNLAGRLDRKTLDDLTLEFRVYPEREPDQGSKPGPNQVDPLLHQDLYSQERTRRFSNWIKRAFDVLTSLTLLIALAPLLFAVALLVRLTSPGPMLFRQLRHGKVGKPFRMLKFRTMYVDAGERPHHEFVSRFIKESGRAQRVGENQLFKLTNDPRITPVGRILRKTSIDELPQLWNVLMGEMSLVGPRPPLPYELEHYAPWHLRRVLEAKPGITGLWQVTGRSRTTFDEMVRLDLRYARTRSLWTDLRILLRTPAAVLGGKGAC